MLGPSLSDWPIQPTRSSTVAQPPRGFWSTRHDLALEHYLERQEADRAAVMASRQAAQAHTRFQPFLYLTNLGRLLKARLESRLYA